MVPHDEDAANRRTQYATGQGLVPVPGPSCGKRTAYHDPEQHLDRLEERVRAVIQPRVALSLAIGSGSCAL